MTKLSDLGGAAGRLLGNRNAVRAALAINAAGAATVRTTSALEYQVDGVMFTRAALSAMALTAMGASDVPGYMQPSGAGGFYPQPPSTTVYYVMCVSPAGTVRAVQGLFSGQQISFRGLTEVGKSVIPDTPDPWIPFGIIRVTTNNATTFVPGTTALDAAGVTVAFFDIGVLPAAEVI